ncbi:hypothetical protein [Candidatus Albibeggiatoa sp. nov. BB20]|uniref:hypothetical protein n=1 Tax=Candidatus Albibeggiatoa sp. nov. BB20 TaxID=3162723 RepID=UPI00336562C1
MDQCGYVTLVNSTDCDWKKTKQHADHLISWDLPQTISAHSSVNIYVEWCDTFLTGESPDAANATYVLEGSNGQSFQLHVQAGESTKLHVALKHLNAYSHSTVARLELNGNDQKGKRAFILAGSNSHYAASSSIGPSWMHKNLGLIGDKKLNQICITGAHDAGMSSLHSHTAAAFDCNTLTQTHPLHTQLNFGARYFDIRPVIAGGRYRTGHYSFIENFFKNTWQGGNGQSIKSIISDVNSFTAVHKELVILNLSHALNTDYDNANYKEFTQNEWDGLFNELRHLNHLYVNHTQNDDLTKITLRTFISETPAVVVIVDEKNVKLRKLASKGFYHSKNFNVYNHYSKTDVFKEMARDQIRKMERHSKDYFLLSWTLTQAWYQAAGCKGGADSIKQLANKANKHLDSYLYPAITKQAFPNIIFVDNILDDKSARIAMKINRAVIKHKT